ncbi:glycosyltransferase [Usitatibacter palustris]|uniref:Rhodanese domain-containing protein n=1 Tax=Usitatibacter palustris TaxID=2732487 RepID=A0A6M4H8M0_9PROT|nr:nucleotide disphospho-sugar-binding domain-containing protein [Usitatibacter palustris]QJR15956.1 hypothetical protein DSM104440_02784 [Usitatibacter palustris]
MRRVLCAWEFGGDLGHIRRLCAIARELQRTGHEPVLALSDPAAAPRDAGFTWYQAPLLTMESRANLAALNASDLLLHLGFSDPVQVAGALRGWRSLFDLVQPSVIVADFAPGALLAARAAGLPRVTVGSGFASPLAGDPLPAFRDWQPVPAERLRASDALLCASINAALASANAKPLANAHDAFEADQDFFCTFAELDPYGVRAGREYFGPLDHGAGGVRIEWSASLHPRVFAYVKPGYPHFAALAAALAQSGGESVIASPGLDTARLAQLTQPGLRIFAEPVDLDSVLPACDLCVGHAGAGFTARAVAAGLPLALLPMHLEQYLVARRLAELGAALVARPEEPAPDFSAWVQRLATDDAMRSAARALGAKYQAHRGEHATQLVAGRIAALAGA